MSRELIINSKQTGIFIALLENKKLLELHKENINKDFSVGDLYIGKVKKISHGLNAAFIDIGSTKDAFLHYQDLGPNVKSIINFLNKKKYIKDFAKNLFSLNENSIIHKNGVINDVLQIGQKLLVQITKESISSKGPRLTSEISLAGRFLVLIPFSEKISISQKIKNLIEKKRLIDIIKNFKPKEFGIIIRTVAQNKKSDLIKSDLYYLMKKWENAKNTIYNDINKLTPFKKILNEEDKVYCILRDSLNNNFTSIICDNKIIYKDICSYLSIIDPEKNYIIKYYNDKNTPIFEKYGVEKQIKISFGKNILFAKGAYLIIEHTEALHVIDVNSGMSESIKGNKDNIALEINLLAAIEIARQLRLRDMGGIIVIDFIDMVKYEDRKKLYKHLKNEMYKDKAKHKILPLSRFGLLQITRQRVRPELNIITNEPNPNNNSKKEIRPPLLHIYYIELTIDNIIKNKSCKKLYLHIHPFIAAYLKAGWVSIQIKWFIRYKKWISVISRYSFRYLEYKIIDENKNVISYYKN